MADDVQEAHRHQLLSVLFGSAVPDALEGQLLRTSDVAMLFQVSERTVSEWAKRGQVPSVRTPGGHRRYPAEGIRRLLQDGRHSSESADGADRGPDPMAARPDPLAALDRRRPAPA
jgi:excisionase family DNA binding protein